MPADRATSNANFAARVGCHFTMASRLRGGGRLPSANMLQKIRHAFEMDDTETAAMLNAHAKGRAAFGAWISDTLFTETADDS